MVTDSLLGHCQKSNAPHLAAHNVLQRAHLLHNLERDREPLPHRDAALRQRLVRGPIAGRQHEARAPSKRTPGHAARRTDSHEHTLTTLTHDRSQQRITHISTVGGGAFHESIYVDQAPAH